MTDHISQCRTPAVLPDDLKAIPTWLVWRLTQIAGEKKPRKVPFYASGSPRSGDQGSDADRAQLVTFEQAAKTAQAGNYSGVGLAVLPDCGIVALDFDDVVADGVVDPRVLNVVDGTYAEYSPSGRGVRAFFKGALPSKKDIVRDRSRVLAADFYPIEVFGTNGFVTVTGNVLPEAALWGYETVLADITPAVRALYDARWGTPLAAPVTGGTGFDLLMSVQPKVGLTREQVEQALAALPSDMSYDDWLKVGMAVHHETGGEGFYLWHAWSQRSPKYTTEKYGADRWRSFGRNTSANPITMLWVLKQAKDARAHEKYEATAEWKKVISQAADEFELREKVCSQIARDGRLGDIEREALAALLRGTLKGFGAVVPLGQCRKLIEPVREAKRLSAEDAPAWLKDWCYVGRDDKFYRYNSNEWLTTQGFNAKYDRYMPRNEDGYIYKSAASAALQDYNIPHVNHATYLPWGGSFFDLNGEPCVNMYRPSSVPEPAAFLSDTGRIAVDTILRHLRLITGNRDDLVQIVVSWMAHNVQSPGVKIRWAPMFKGIQGDGKSTLGKLMKSVMGEVNVKNVSPKVLATDFTGWGEGSAVSLFEEVRIVGENRHNILNSIKPYVTNDEVPIHRKGRDEYEIVNVTNYMAFTNYADALPLDDTDRRWLIIFLPFASSDEMAAAVASDFPDLDAYFANLHAAITTQRGELRKWLLDYPIPATFRPNGNAPMTDEKRSMIAMSMSDEETAVREAIERGAEGVTASAIVTKYLMGALSFHESGAGLSSKDVARILTKLGYVKAPKMRWKPDEPTVNVWVRGDVSRSASKIRAELDANLQKTASCDDPFQ